MNMRNCVSAILLLMGLSVHAFAQSEPFSTTEAPFGSPAMDGDISDWMAMRNDSNVLNFSFGHGSRDGNDVGAPLEVNIQYAWDNENFYFLVEEISDDDPSSDLLDLDWCQECAGSFPGPAPWSTDSVGFYDQGITWPANGDPGDVDPLGTNLQEVGPYTQFWVGLPTAADMVVDDEKQNYHLVRSLDTGGGEGNSARLIGDRSMENRHVAMIPDKPELTAVQSAHGIIEDGENDGRGRRFTEAFMRWDQIRYPDPEKNDLGDPEELDDDGIPVNPVAARIEALNNPDDADLELDVLKGHYVEDIGEGYEFRLDPLLVDGLEETNDAGEFPFGGQTHPSGKLHPNVDAVMDWSETSVVRLVAGSEVTCVVPTDGIAGDLDGSGDVAFADFLALSANFGATDVPYSQGDIDCDGSVAFADFLVLSANFGQSAAASSVPEPTTWAMLAFGIGLMGLTQRRRR